MMYCCALQLTSSSGRVVISVRRSRRESSHSSAARAVSQCHHRSLRVGSCVLISTSEASRFGQRDSRAADQ
eukprot:scaffold612114_cov17-Prasinocladus_malaysianus.AAC.1